MKAKLNSLILLVSFLVFASSSMAFQNMMRVLSDKDRTVMLDDLKSGKVSQDQVEIKIMKDGSLGLFEVSNITVPSNTAVFNDFNGIQGDWESLFDPTNAPLVQNPPNVNSLHQTESGNLYATGSFDLNNGIQHIARWSGSEWLDVGGGLPMNLSAISSDGENLFVAPHGHLHGETAIYYYDALENTWEALFDNFWGEIKVLHFYDDTLYVGGSFHYYDFDTDIEFNNIMYWDGDDFHSMMKGIHGTVNTITHDEYGNIFIGGSIWGFDDYNYNYNELNNIALWDGEWFHPLSGGIGGYVETLLYHENRLYAGGYFYEAGMQNAKMIAYFDYSDESWHQLGTGLSSSVNALAADGSNIYAGGHFFSDGDYNIELFNIVKWDGSEWISFGEVFGGVETIALIGSNLYIGGEFDYIYDSEEFHVNAVAQWDGILWSDMDGGFDKGGELYPGSIEKITIYDGYLYFRGHFNQLGETEAWEIGRMSIETGIVSTNFIEDWNLHGGIYNMFVVDNKLFISGHFHNANLVIYDGLTANHVEYAPNHINAIAEFNGMTYFGGHFDDVYIGSGQYVSSPNIIAWDGTNYHKVGNGLSYEVMTLEVIGDSLFVGGSFWTAYNSDGSDVNVNGLAIWFDDEWYTLPDHGLSERNVHKMIHHDRQLYIIGHNNDLSHMPSNFRWYNFDDETWKQPGSEYEMHGHIADIMTVDHTVVLAGGFDIYKNHMNIGGFGLFLWDGNNFASLGGGVNHGWAHSLSRIDSEILVGGSFTESGYISTYGLSAFTPNPFDVILNYPVDVNVDQNEVTLVWQTASFADEYIVELSKDYEFQTDVFNETTTELNVTFDELDYQSLYFWRVRGSNDVGFGNWSYTANFVTPIEPAEIVQLVEPSNEATQLPLDLILLWDKSDRSEYYIIQISLEDNFDAPEPDLLIDEDIQNNWFQISGLLQETTYYWRVFAQNSTGGYGWSAHWSFTTLFDRPEAVNLISPAHNATNQQVVVTLSWEDTEADSYILELSRDQNFKSSTVFSAIEENSFTTENLRFSTAYFWRVRSVVDGLVGSFSEVRKFTTSELLLTAVDPVLPVDSATNVHPHTYLSWKATYGALSYDVKMATDKAFTDLVIDSTGISSNWIATPVLENAESYYWTIRAVHDEISGIWSDTVMFTTMISTPNAPQLVHPANNATNMVIPAELNWMIHDGASTYTLEVSEDILFESATFYKNIADTSIILTDMIPGHTYFWRVQAYANGIAGEWSEIRNFSTENPILAKAVLHSPLNEAGNINIPTTFTWLKVNHAEKYSLEIAADTSFDVVTSIRNISDTTYSVDRLEWHSEYYWRVLAYSSSAIGSVSDIRSYTTLLPVPDAPSWEPDDNAEDVATDIVLVWAPSAFAETYQAQLATVSNFSELIVDESNLSTTSLEVTGLEEGKNYYWRVRASNSSGMSAWSESRSFTTLAPTSIEEQILPISFALGNNFPNPFNPVTVIAFEVPQETNVKISIYNTLGQKVAILIDAPVSAGYHNVSFDASRLSSGVYLYMMQANEFVSTKKMILLK